MRRGTDVDDRWWWVLSRPGSHGRSAADHAVGHASGHSRQALFETAAWVRIDASHQADKAPALDPPTQARFELSIVSRQDQSIVSLQKAIDINHANIIGMKPPKSALEFFPVDIGQ